MSKNHQKTISITGEIEEKARELSVDILGKDNFSGLVSYLINKAYKESEK